MTKRFGPTRGLTISAAIGPADDLAGDGATSSRAREDADSANDDAAGTVEAQGG